MWRNRSPIFPVLLQYPGELLDKYPAPGHSLPLFSSPEPKAQVSYSDQNLSVVRRRCRPNRCCCKLFTFSSSPEPLGHFLPNSAQSILGWRGFKFIQMKNPTVLQWGKLRNSENIHRWNFKNVSRTTRPISLKFGHKASLG